MTEDYKRLEELAKHDFLINECAIMDAGEIYYSSKLGDFFIAIEVWMEGLNLVLATIKIHDKEFTIKDKEALGILYKVEKGPLGIEYSEKLTPAFNRKELFTFCLKYQSRDKALAAALMKYFYAPKYRLSNKKKYSLVEGSYGQYYVRAVGTPARMGSFNKQN